MVLIMSRKKVFLLLVSLAVMTSLFAGFVLAQQQQGDTFKLAEIFETIEGFDVFEAYQKFPFLIDTLIYFLFFISIAMATLGQHFKGSGGKGVVIAAGLALSVGISFWAQKVGFKLGNLGPLAALIFALVIGIWIYRIVRGDKEAGAGIWISIIVIWVAFNMFFPQLVNTLQENKWGKLLLGVLTLLFIIALPMAAAQFFKGGGERGEESGRWGGLWPGGGKKGDGKGRDEKEEKEEEKKILEEEKKALGQTERERELMGKIINVDVKDLDTDTKLKQYLTNARNFVQAYLASPFSRAGIRSYDQFRRRKETLIPEIEKVLGIVRNREERDRRINEIINYNRILLNNILTILRSMGRSAATRAHQDMLLNVVREKFRPTSHVPIKDSLISTTGRAERITKIEKHLNEVILKQHKERRVAL